MKLPLLCLLLVAVACVAPKSQRSQVDPVERPRMEFSRPRIENEHNVNWVAHFQVKNLSNRTLEFVKIDATFYDKDDNFLKSESLYYIERYQGLPPGEISNALVQTPYDPKIRGVSLRFSCNGERAFDKVDIDAVEVARLSK